MAPLTVGVVTDTKAGLAFGQSLESIALCTVVVYSKEHSDQLKSNRDEMEDLQKKTKDLEESLTQQT